MKRTICLILGIVFVFSFSINACAISNDILRWYTKFPSNNAPPQLGKDQEIIRKYNAFFMHKNGAEDKKVIYLTFDVGYYNENLASVLKTLKEQKVPASFFVLSHLVTANADIVKQMGEDGHLICNHTARHKNMTNATKEEFQKELNTLEYLVKEHTGYEVAKFYRPPRGEYNEKNLAWAQELGYTTVFWSLAYDDWDNNRQQSSERAINLLSQRIHPGAIVLLHPTSQTNAKILNSLIEKWRAEGYTFASLNDL